MAKRYHSSLISESASADSHLPTEVVVKKINKESGSNFEVESDLYSAVEKQLNQERSSLNTARMKTPKKF